MNESLRRYYLKQMGIDVWELKEKKNVPIGMHADWMIIGETPDAGKADALFNAMLFSVGKTREEVCFINIQEVLACESFLTQQIQANPPKIMLSLGKRASQFLLNTQESVESLRGKITTWGEDNIPVLVSYHPAYLLRNPSEKSKAWVDWLLLKKQLNYQS